MACGTSHARTRQHFVYILFMMRSRLHRAWNKPKPRHHFYIIDTAALSLQSYGAVVESLAGHLRLVTFYWI